MANILFEYLYRDASNFKQHGQAIFSNNKNLTLADIAAQIVAALHDEQWFFAEKVELETCFFSTQNDDDHPWHEFDCVQETDSPVTDVRDIALFIQEMQAWHQMGWESDRQLCHICKGAFTEEEWEDRHNLHEPDCPRAKTAGMKTFGEIFCNCNLVAHARCCPDCNRDGQPKIDEAERVFPLPCYICHQPFPNDERHIHMDIHTGLCAHRAIPQNR
jgi:hypothetical protein